MEKNPYHSEFRDLSGNLAGNSNPFTFNSDRKTRRMPDRSAHNRPKLKQKDLLAEILWYFGLFLIYYIAGKLGLMLAFEHASASSVWAPTGIALAAFLFKGYRMWPSVLLGAFLFNITTTGDIFSSVCIAFGNTAEGLLGAYLVNKYAGGRYTFDKSQNILNFILLAGVVSTAVSATIGVASLAISGLAEWSSYWAIWKTWWLGDAVGAFLFTPLILSWLNPKDGTVHAARLFEFSLVILSLVVICIIEFAPFSIIAKENYPFSYLLIPPFVWMAFRLDQRVVVTAAVMLGLIAIWGTLNHLGPFVIDSPDDSLLFLQTFTSLVTLMSLIFAAVVNEKNNNDKRIRESEEELREFVDNAALGIHWIDPQGIIKWANKTELSVLGYSEDEYIGHHLSEFHADPEICSTILEHIHNYETLDGFEAKLLCKDGTVRTFLISSDVYRRKSEVFYTRCFTRDITDRKLIEEELKLRERALHETENKSKLQLEQMLENMTAGVYTCNADGLITYFNKRAEALWGRKPLLNDPSYRYCGSFREYLDNTLVKPEDCWMAKALKEDKRFHEREVIIERPDGSKIPVIANANPIHDESGNVIGAINVLIDISERTELERQLQRKQGELIDFVENASIGMHWVGPHGTILWANKNELEMLGYKRDEYVGHHLSEFHCSREAVDAILECLASNKTLNNYEARLKCKDGSVKDVQISSNAYFEDGKFIHTRCFTRDTTDRKKALESLKRSEEEFRLLFDLAGSGKALTDVDTGKFLRINKKFCEFIGYDREELKDKNFTDITHPDDLEKYLNLYKNVLKGNTGTSIEIKYLHKNGSIVWGNVNCSVLRSPDGISTKIFTIMQDITEKKIAEKHLNVQYSISKSLAESKTFKEASYNVLESICGGLYWDLGLIWMVDEVNNRLIFESSWHNGSRKIMSSGMTEPEMTFRKGEGLPGRVWKFKKPTWIRDVIHDKNFPRAHFAIKAGLHTGFAFPITFNGNVIAIIECFCSKIMEPKNDLLAVLNATGRQIGNFLARKKAEEEKEIAQGTYAALFESTLDGILIIDENGVYKDVNESYCKMLKATREQLLGEKFEKFMPPDLIHNAAEAFSELKSKGFFKGEFPLLAIDGTIVEAEWISKANILPGMHLCVARDISERKLSEMKLMTEYSFRKAIEGSVAAGIAAISFEGVQTYVNPAFCNLLGWTEEELIGAEPPYVYWPEEEIENISRAFSSVLSGFPPREGFELRFCRKDGNRIDVLVVFTPIIDSKGNQSGWLASVTDITEIKKTQSALKEAHDKLEERVKDRTIELNLTIDELEKEIHERRRTEKKLQQTFEKLKQTQNELVHSEKLASLGRFSAGIAHEIRNPLANINSLAQLLSKKMNDPDLKKHLNYILENSHIANKIIKDLLNFASPHNINFVKTDPAALLGDLYNIVKTRCGKNKIRLIKNIDENMPEIIINKEKIQTAFLNFISNSIDAMPRGGDLIISATHNKLNNELVITFEDTGEGIHKSNIDKILEPFFTTKSDGTGLGLALAYNVIKAHNGDIKINSQPGKGTKITVKLPVISDVIQYEKNSNSR